MDWPKNTIHWTENNKAFVSVPFTWNLPEAFSTCVDYKQRGYEVHAGGPATVLIPEVLKDVAIIGESINALPLHNSNATRFSTGCVNNCPFCAVKKIEGDLQERRGDPNPIVCDNNLFACSRKHFDWVIDTLKPVPEIDFNQGLDCRLINAHHIERLQELDIKYIRFSWDYLAEEPFVMDAISRIRTAGYPKDKIRIYGLFNFFNEVTGKGDTQEDTTYRFRTLKKMGIVLNPMRYQPLDTLKRDSYVSPLWIRGELKRFTRYWNRANWLGGIDYAKFRG